MSAYLILPSGTRDLRHAERSEENHWQVSRMSDQSVSTACKNAVWFGYSFLAYFTLHTMTTLDASSHSLPILAKNIA
jgi:hypothetical protein